MEAILDKWSAKLHDKWTYRYGVLIFFLFEKYKNILIIFTIETDNMQ
jgi:hypothetical protein